MNDLEIVNNDDPERVFCNFRISPIVLLIL